jgi:hypothetical protein
MTLTMPIPTKPQPRKYFPIWEMISKLPVGKETPVRVHHTACKTMIQAVSKEKSIETASKKKLGMRFAGKLVVRETVDPSDGEFRIVYFSLEWDGRRL